jgi:adenylate cyclase
MNIYTHTHIYLMIYIYIYTYLMNKNEPSTMAVMHRTSFYLWSCNQTPCESARQVWVQTYANMVVLFRWVERDIMKTVDRNGSHMFFLAILKSRG